MTTHTQLFLETILKISYLLSFGLGFYVVVGLAILDHRCHENQNETTVYFRRDSRLLVTVSTSPTTKSVI